jgi:ABC-type uncharacterized transport system substrate-binding protein
VRRREFIALLGVTAAVPRASRAQGGDTNRKIGVLMGLAADDPQSQDRIGAFQQALRKLGWIEGRNLQIHIRRSAGLTDTTQQQAAELVALEPDAILASGGSVVGPLLRATRTIPIVFTQTADPVAAGFVASLARPGGNATGFTTSEYGTSGKLLELLKEIAPGVMRVAVLRDPSIPAGIGQFASIQSVASAFAVELKPIDVRYTGVIEREIAELSRGSNCGLIVTSSASAAVHRELIIELAAKHRLPAAYSYRYFAASGGLISYGPDPIDQFQRAAGYIDRIFRGEEPDELPVQVPTKYELAINLKTAKAMDLSVPQTLLARASEVIE